MHGFPVRVVAVTNIDLEIMSRRTPTDNAVRVEEGHRRLGVRALTGVGLRELRSPAERNF
jgi:hypothetical protein